MDGVTVVTVYASARASTCHSPTQVMPDASPGEVRAASGARVMAEPDTLVKDSASAARHSPHGVRVRYIDIRQRGAPGAQPTLRKCLRTRGDGESGLCGRGGGDGFRAAARRCCCGGSGSSFDLKLLQQNAHQRDRLVGNAWQVRLSRRACLVCSRVAGWPLFSRHQCASAVAQAPHKPQLCSPGTLTLWSQRWGSTRSWQERQARSR